MRGEIYYLFLIGVCASHRKNHLSNLLLREIALLGKILGYKSMVTEATNYLTQRAIISTYKKFKVWNEIVYKEHKNSKGE